MKKIFSIVLILLSLSIQSQNIHFVDDEYFTASLAVDPSASLKEDSPNVAFEIELVSYWKYVKANVQVLPGLEGGYLDLTGGFGANLTHGKFDKVRYYGGVRLGVIKRGMDEGETCTYPMWGLEGGIDVKLTDSFFIGVRTTGDWREDFLYTGGEPGLRYSGFGRVGFKF